MHIRGEMTSGKLTLSGFVRSRLESLWWFEVDFWPRSVHFRRGPPTIFRKHMPSGMGTESLRVIGCIFAENGPLEGGIEASFWGTGWGAKGDFMRYSYLYPYIFESRTHTFFESKCPELCAHQSWEWSDAYSWRNDLRKVEFERVCKKPVGVLMVIWSGFMATMHAFTKGAPHNVPKAHALRYTHSKFGNGRMYIRGEWALRRWHWIQFWGTGGGAKGEFRWIFGLNPCIFEGGPHHFPKAHALRYGYRKFRNDRMYIRGEWALRRWHRMKFEWYRPRC